MCWWLKMGVTGSRPAPPVRVVHAGGHVDRYHGRVTVDELMRSHPRHYVTRPEVFQAPSSALLAPEVVLAPGEKLLLVPYRTVVKLHRKHGLPLPSIVPATPTRPCGKVEGQEKDAGSPSVAHGCCPSVRHDSDCRSRSLKIPAASGGATGVEKSGSSHYRPSSRGGIRRRSGLSEHGAARGSPRARARKGVRGGRTPTRGRKSPGTSAYKPPDRKILRNSKLPKPGEKASSLHSNVSTGNRPSREGLDVKSPAAGCCKSNNMKKVFPVQDGPEQVLVPACGVVVQTEVSELHAASLASQVNSEIVKAAIPIQTSGKIAPDTKCAPRTGHLHANRSRHKQIEDGRHGKPGDELVALVKRISNFALQTGRATSSERKTEHAMPPTAVSVKEKVQMFEAAARAARPVSFQRPKKPRTEIGASDNRLSDQVLDYVKETKLKETKPKTLSDSSAPSIHAKSDTKSVAPMQASGSSVGVMEPTLAFFGTVSKSPALLFAFAPPAQLASMQVELSQAPHTVDLAHASNAGFTTGNGKSLSGKISVRRRVHGRASRTLRELIAHADFQDKQQAALQQGYVTPAEEMVSCIADSEPMQQDHLPVGRTTSASQNDFMGSPDSDDSFIEFVFDEFKFETAAAVPSLEDREWKAGEVENSDHSDMEQKLSGVGEKSGVTELLPGSVNGDNISGQVEGKLLRPKLRDHPQVPSPPTDVGFPSRTPGLSVTPDAIRSTGSNSTVTSSPDESPLLREVETPNHPIRMSAGDKGARRMKHLPKPYRPPIGGWRRYRYRWRPKLSPLIEAATEGGTEVRSMS